MCDFEPLNHHVETLHQLVQAAQSVDEMSQTITDLLSEQRVMSASPIHSSSVDFYLTNFKMHLIAIHQSMAINYNKEALNHVLLQLMRLIHCSVHH